MEEKGKDGGWSFFSKQEISTNQLERECKGRWSMERKWRQREARKVVIRRGRRRWNMTARKEERQVMHPEARRDFGEGCHAKDGA